MTVSVESASASDEEEVVSLWRVTGLVVAYNDPTADFRMARGGPASDVIVARAHGAIVGAAMVGHDGHRGWLWYLATQPDRRREGIGRRLVQSAEDWLRQRGVRKLQLMIRTENAVVQGFYRRLGFEDTPRVVMARWLDR